MQMPPAQMTAEDLVMQSAVHLQNPRPYDLDPALVGAANHHQQQLQYQPEMHYRPGSAQHGLPYEPYQGSFVEGDSHVLEGRSDEHEDVDSAAGPAATGKKQTKSSAANDSEMRELFRANSHRALPDVAEELHGNERGPQSERQRQVFAMIWYV